MGARLSGGIPSPSGRRWRAAPDEGSGATLIRPASPATFSQREKGTPAVLGLKLVAALGLAAGLAGCNPAGYPSCFRVECPYPPVYHASYAGYVPAYAPGRPAFGEPPWDDPFADYTWRGVTVSPGAGNAQAANAALQTATPWPRHAYNTNIPGNGKAMVKAVHDYESGKRPSLGGGGGMSGGGGGMRRRRRWDERRAVAGSCSARCNPGRQRRPPEDRSNVDGELRNSLSSELAVLT